MTGEPPPLPPHIAALFAKQVTAEARLIEHPDQTSPMTVGPELFYEEHSAARYTCLSDTLSELLDTISDDPEFPGFTCFRTQDGQWQVSLPRGSRSVWTVNTYDSIADGLSELYVKWKER